MSFLAELEAFIDARVDAKLRQVGVAGAEYSSTSLPPNTTARTFARWCRSGRVAGAERDGSSWRCSVEAWRAARSQGPRVDQRDTKPANDAGEDLDAMLSSSGLRPTARAR